MATPLIHLSLPDSTGPEHFAPLQILLEGLAQVNEWHIRRANRSAEKGEGMPIPPLYASGVRYLEDPPGREDWCDCLRVLKKKTGDCDQLTAWRVGELRAMDVPCEPVLKWQWIPRDVFLEMQKSAADRKKWAKQLGDQAGVWMVHCLVRYLDDGSIEDPSKILGMGGEYTSKI